jgi:protein required for attachment to host cells
LIRFDVTLGQSQVYESLWQRIYEYDAQQRVKAREHKNQYQKEYWAKQSADPVYRERKRLEQQHRRQLKKEQLRAQVTKLVAIA